MSEETVRLSVPLTIAQRNAIKAKAAQVGLSQAVVVRRFLFAWLYDEIELPDESPMEWILSEDKPCPECEGKE